MIHIPTMNAGRDEEQQEEKDRNRPNTVKGAVLNYVRAY